jgi:hypothetical protein
MRYPTTDTSDATIRVRYVPGRSAPCFDNGERLYAISERTLASLGFAVIPTPDTPAAGTGA